MGREIRRVPPGWEHPKTDRYGRHEFQPMYDRSYRQAADAWEEGFRAWKPEEHDGTRFWEDEGDPPDPKFYRPDWKPEEMTGWCLYETVSEGTPVTPVFEDAEGLIRYLAEHGQCDGWAHGGMGMERARAFVESGGWAPSFFFTPGRGVQKGVDYVADEALAKREERT